MQRKVLNASKSLSDLLVKSAQIYVFQLTVILTVWKLPTQRICTNPLWNF